MDIRLIIFDCDGVIADSEVLSSAVLIDQLGALGIAVTPADVRRDFLGRSFPTVAQTIRQNHARPLPDSFEADYRARLLDRFTAELGPTPVFWRPTGSRTGSLLQARSAVASPRPICSFWRRGRWAARPRRPL